MRPDELLPAHLAGRLRPWTGHDEDFVRATRDENAAMVCNTLLARCFGDATEIERLLVHERDLALVAVRWSTLGSVLPVEVTCQACAAQHDVSIDLDRLVRPDAVLDEIAIGPAIVRIPTAGDQAAIVAHDDALPEQRRARLLARCIRSIDGVESVDVHALDPILRAQIESGLEGAIPDIDLELVLDCPACGVSIEAGVQLGAMVLAELRDGSAHLLRDVHVLARAYHWSERDILALTIGRRREYLSLIDVDQTTSILVEARD
ncbi:MAG: hypothetical protein ACKV2T_00715 [Kofleriaceae bacterium]